MKNLLFITALTFSFLLEADYSTHKDSQMLIDELVKEYGFEEAYVIKVLQNAKRRDEMLKKVANPAEKTKTWDDYKGIFIKKKRITDGKKFIRENINTLERAESEFGVPKEIITAILGVETNFGGNMGSFRVIDS